MNRQPSILNRFDPTTLAIARDYPARYVRTPRVGPRLRWSITSPVTGRAQYVVLQANREGHLTGASCTCYTARNQGNQADCAHAATAALSYLTPPTERARRAAPNSAGRRAGR